MDWTRRDLLGSDAPLKWKLTDAGPRIQAPAAKPCEHDVAYRIVLE